MGGYLVVWTAFGLAAYAGALMAVVLVALGLATVVAPGLLQTTM